LFLGVAQALACDRRHDDIHALERSLEQMPLLTVAVPGEGWELRGKGGDNVRGGGVYMEDTKA